MRQEDDNGNCIDNCSLDGADGTVGEDINNSTVRYKIIFCGMAHL
jgi:hypothetical protein